CSRGSRCPEKAAMPLTSAAASSSRKYACKDLEGVVAKRADGVYDVAALRVSKAPGNNRRPLGSSPSEQCTCADFDGGAPTITADGFPCTSEDDGPRLQGLRSAAGELIGLYPRGAEPMRLFAAPLVPQSGSAAHPLVVQLAASIAHDLQEAGPLNST